MHKKSDFKLAPSSNSQYRKAAALLQEYSNDGVFYPDAQNLDALLQKIADSLQNLVQINENQQLENSTAFADTGADDLFYHNRGYSFAMWQMVKTLGADYRQIILDHDFYVDWTYFVNSLKKAAEFEPTIVRNGNVSGSLVPNHLLVQNYYLLRAVSSAHKIRLKLLEISDADKN